MAMGDSIAELGINHEGKLIGAKRNCDRRGGVGGMKYKLEMNCEAETEKQKMFEKILQKYILRSMCVHNNRNPF